MSQRDVVAEIRAAEVEVPSELRERVRLIAAAAPPERRSFGSLFTRPRLAALLIPAVGAAAIAVVATRPSHHPLAVEPVTRSLVSPLGASSNGQQPEAKAAAVPGAADLHGTTVAPSSTRPQKYSASLTLRVRNATAVSNATKRAVAVVTSLGGYVVSANVDTGKTEAFSDLVLKVPKTNVRQAVARLSALGTITAEQVNIQDLQAGIATTDRTIARLQRQLKSLRTQPVTPALTRQIAAITTHIQRLQRADAAALRAARYATVNLHLATPTPVPPKHHGHGPLHGLGVAFRWIGIGAIYGAALGLPALVLLALAWFGVRTVRRRREDALLSRA